MEVMFRNRIHLPADLAMLARGVTVLEGVALSLDPDYVLVEKVRPFAQRLIKERVSVRHLGERALRALRDYDELVRVLPKRLENLSDQLERGNLTVGFDLRHMPMIFAKLDMIANRLSFSILVAALIVGSALIIMGGQSVSVWRLPILGWGLHVAQLSFVASGVLAAWLLISIIRSRGL
jgi:ubiquinone biosynthesis protein